MSKEEKREVTIDTRERVAVTMTDKSKVIKPGTTVEVAVKVAERWVKSGKANYAKGKKE